MSMKSFAFTAGLLAAAPLMIATAPAFAQAADLQRVEVSGRTLPGLTRFDVSKVCPGVAQSLQESLAYTAFREGTPGLVRVNFVLTGNKVAEVQSPAGPWHYRGAARRAVYGLSCADAANAQPQQFSFIISFNAPQADGSPQMAGASGARVALLEQ